jgi:perosamine synthetase
MIPVNRPLLNGNEEKYLLECIRSGWISGEGAVVREFEGEVARRVGRLHAIAVANGSAALEIAVAALRLASGDEVILPTFTIISCAAAVVRAGAVPVLVDSDPYTWNMRPEAVAERITPRTRAIMAVHIYGMPVDMDPLVHLAEQHGLTIIEDAAEALGQHYRGRPCGGFGALSTFSFYANKHVTTGEGGMLLTDDEDLAQRCRQLRNLYFEPHRRFVHEELGWNSRMTGLQAAVGLAQLERLEVIVARKRDIGTRYTSLLAGIPALNLAVERTSYARNTYWVYGLVMRDDVPFDNTDAMGRLRALGVDTRPFFWPMHEQPVFRRAGMFQNEAYPVAERIARRGFYLPSGVGLTDDEIDEVADAVHEVFA